MDLIVFPQNVYVEGLTPHDHIGEKTVEVMIKGSWGHEGRAWCDRMGALIGRGRDTGALSVMWGHGEEEAMWKEARRSPSPEHKHAGLLISDV